MITRNDFIKIVSKEYKINYGGKTRTHLTQQRMVTL